MVVPGGGFPLPLPAIHPLRGKAAQGSDDPKALAKGVLRALREQRQAVDEVVASWVDLGATAVSGGDFEAGDTRLREAVVSSIGKPTQRGQIAPRQSRGPGGNDQPRPLEVRPRATETHSSESARLLALQRAGRVGTLPGDIQQLLRMSVRSGDLSETAVLYSMALEDPTMWRQPLLEEDPLAFACREILGGTSRRISALDHCEPASIENRLISRWLDLRVSRGLGLFLDSKLARHLANLRPPPRHAVLQLSVLCASIKEHKVILLPTSSPRMQALVDAESETSAPFALEERPTILESGVSAATLRSFRDMPPLADSTKIAIDCIGPGPVDIDTTRVALAATAQERQAAVQRFLRKSLLGPAAAGRDSGPKREEERFMRSLPQPVFLELCRTRFQQDQEQQPSSRFGTAHSSQEQDRRRAGEAGPLGERLSGYLSNALREVTREHALREVTRMLEFR